MNLKYLKLGIIIILLLLLVIILSYKCDNIYINYILQNNIDKNGVGSKYIPKKIHQLIPDKNNIHINIQKNINKLKRMNPDWDYFLYDDVDIINYLKINCDPEILRVYNMINPEYGPARADFFRYILMYQQGGIYLDIKSSVNIPFNSIIKRDDEYILSHWITREQREILNYTNGEFQQWHIICRPFHPFLESVINNVIKNIYNYDFERDGYGKIAVLKLTGPIVYTQSIIPLLPKYKHTIYRRNEYIGLVYSIFSIIGYRHENLFKKHYSLLKTPLVLKTYIKND